MSTALWICMHYMFWDGYDTRPHEEVDANGIYQIMTDPDLVSRNIVANLYMSAGMTIMMSVTMAIPMLLVSYYNSYGDRGAITQITMYRVTHHIDSNLPLTSKQKFHFSMRPVY